MPKSRKRAEPSGVQMSTNDVSIAKAMLSRGDRQHDIAAWFGVNGGRIAEIATGKVYEGIPEAEHSNLPPSGPYPSGREAMIALAALKEAQAALERASQLLRR